MACSIEILIVEAVPSSVNTGITSSIKVSGTATECKNLVVEIVCAGGNVKVPVVVQSDGAWSSELDVPCRCDGAYKLTVTCKENPQCQKALGGTITCDEGDCPSAVLTFAGDDVIFAPCNPDGTRTYTFFVSITPGLNPNIVSYLDFGDGTFSQPTTSLNYPVSHDYSPGPSYVVKLIFALPENCPSSELTVGPDDPCECPEVSNIQVNVSGCAGAGNSAVVAITGITAANTPGCTFKWDFGDESPEQTTSTPSTTHAYTSPGTFSGAVVMVCGDCIGITPFTVEIAPCCPIVENISSTTSGCADGGGQSASVTFVAQTNPSPAAGTYTWNFGDGTPLVTTTGPVVTHAYESSGNVNVTVEFNPDDPACPNSNFNSSLGIPGCGGGTPTEDDPGDGGFSCFGLRIGMVITAILAALALYICICVPGGAPTFCWVAAGFAAALALLGLIWGIFCPKPCKWGLLLAWQLALGTGIAALYIANCCPVLWAIGAGLIASAAIPFELWRRQCDASKCTIYAELAIVMSGVLIPVFGWLAGIPILAACFNPIVTGIVGTIAGLLALALIRCQQIART